ncbi:MAG: RidA family protein [Planctomycetota bacterium]|jgi:enamine deaminase RidA (YjgF/YER057c/UK114 family)
MKESSNPATVTRTFSDKLDAVTVSRCCFKKLYITAHPTAADDPYQMFENLAAFLEENDAAIVSQDVFGSCQLQSDGLRALARVFGQIKWPVTWIEGEGRLPKSLTGTQVYAISGTSVAPIHSDGRIIGSIFEDDDAEYCLLGDLRPHDISRANSKQARDLFETMEAALRLARMHFANVVRTWLYINKILTWYGPFNEIRNDFFSHRGLFEGVIPASTGIGAGNCPGAAVVAEALAIRPKKQSVCIQAVPSPLQCPAPHYKSSFSRAVEVVLSDHRRLYISGTASIEPGGKTIHTGNIKSQIGRTMEVVRAILESRQMGWTDISRAVAYFKDIEHAPLLDTFCRENRLPALPVAVAHADICRDDLLFEIEADAVVV